MIEGNGLGADQVRQMVESVSFWWHSIDVGNGIVTPGKKSREWLEKETNALQLPSLNGKTVLDIGAWDGYYSFMAERLGAKRVVALDHYAWSIDRKTADAFHILYAHSKSAVPRIENSACWEPDKMPGKQGFDTAHKLLNSGVQDVHADFMTIDPKYLGKFDIVLFLGVLYHMENPLASLRKLAEFTDTLAVIETHAIVLPAYEHRSVCEFYPCGELDGDVSNWWGPNLMALKAMCLAAGFNRVEVKQGPPHRSLIHKALQRLQLFFSGSRQRRPRYFRAIVHAWK